MLSSPQLEIILQHIRPDLKDIVRELRDMIVSIAPGVAETRHSRGFSYYFKERGGQVSAGVC